MYGTGLAGSLTYSSNALAFVVRGRIERQPAAGVQIERFFGRVLRRPGIEVPPLVRAGFEHIGFGEIEFFCLAFGVFASAVFSLLSASCFIVFEKMLQERQLDILAVILATFWRRTRRCPVVAIRPATNRRATTGPSPARCRCPGFSRSVSRYVFSVPNKSSASNQPPTVITAACTFFKCGQSVRACQNSS